MSAVSTAAGHTDDAASPSSAARSAADPAAASRLASSDPDLALEVLAHTDGAAFDELVRRHRRSVEGYLRRRLGDFDLALDAAQETFLRAYERLGRYQPGCSFAGWLLAIADNVAHELMRARRRAPVEWSEASERHYSPLVLEPEAVDTLDLREQSARVREAVAQLPVHLALPAVLRFYHEADLHDISHLLDISIAAVKMRLSRARRMIKAIAARTGSPLPQSTAINLAACYWQLGEMLYMRRKWEAGARAYAAAFVLEDSLGYRLWVIAQDIRGAPENAELVAQMAVALRRGLRARPRSTWLLTAVGNFNFWILGRPRDAEHYFERAAEAGITGLPVMHRAHVCSSRGQFGEAIDLLDLYQRRQWFSPFYFPIVGDALVKAGRINDALWAARQGLAQADAVLSERQIHKGPTVFTRPRNMRPALLKMSGDIFLRAGMPDAARDCYHRALASDNPPQHLIVGTEAVLQKLCAHAPVEQLLD